MPHHSSILSCYRKEWHVLGDLIGKDLKQLSMAVNQTCKFGNDILFNTSLSLTRPQYPIHSQFLAMLPLIYFPSPPTYYNPVIISEQNIIASHLENCSSLLTGLSASSSVLLQIILPLQTKESFKVTNLFMFLFYLIFLKDFPSHWEWNPKSSSWPSKPHIQWSLPLYLSVLTFSQSPLIF